MIENMLILNVVAIFLVSLASALEAEDRWESWSEFLSTALTLVAVSVVVWVTITVVYLVDLFW